MVGLYSLHWLPENPAYLLVMLGILEPAGLFFPSAPSFMSMDEDSVFDYANIWKGTFLGYGSLGANIRHLPSSGRFHGGGEESV